MTGPWVSIASALALLVVCSVNLLAGEIASADRKSGSAFMTPETQAMQEDDRANPGMLAVL